MSTKTKAQKRSKKRKYAGPSFNKSRKVCLFYFNVISCYFLNALYKENKI